MAASWKPEGVTWYLDDMPIAWWKGDFHEPLALIANMAVADFEGSLGGKILPTTNFPAQMQVDYIRVWQEKSDQKIRLKTNNTFERSAEKKSGQILKKNRPMYKRSRIKEDFERYYLNLNAERILHIYRIGTTPSTRTIKVFKDQELVIEKTIQYKNETLSLLSLPPGIYKLQIGSGSQYSVIELEMP